jgi:excisionase family DNA binding protein
MSTLDPGVTGRRHKARVSPKKRKKKRPGRGEAIRAKRAASAMATVEDLAAELGIGRNQAYALVQMKAVPSVRAGRRYLIPRSVLAKIASGEMLPQVPQGAAEKWRYAREAAATGNTA